MRASNWRGAALDRVQKTSVIFLGARMTANSPETGGSRERFNA